MGVLKLDNNNEWNQVERVILERRSIRYFKEEQVPQELVKRVLEAGRFAPSHGNCQPWKFVVIRDRKMLDEMTASVAEICKNLTAMMAEIKPPEPLHPIPYKAVIRLSLGRTFLFHHAPTAIIIFKDVRGISNPDLDCGIAGQNMVLAAHSLGLGTCWISFARLLFQYAAEWNERLGVEYPWEFASSIVLGYPRGKPDGMIERDTHAIEWYEDGSKKIIY